MPLVAGLTIGHLIFGGAVMGAGAMIMGNEARKDAREEAARAREAAEKGRKNALNSLGDIKTGPSANAKKNAESRVTMNQQPMQGQPRVVSNPYVNYRPNVNPQQVPEGPIVDPQQQLLGQVAPPPRNDLYQQYMNNV